MRPIRRAMAAVPLLAALSTLTGCVGAPAPGPVSAYPAAYPPSYAPPGYAQPGYAQPGYAQPGYPQPGYAQPEYAQPRPEAGQQVALGSRCYAGIYTCSLPQDLPVGAQCSCPGLGAPSFGNVR